jgi:hypothetical protein
MDKDVKLGFVLFRDGTQRDLIGTPDGQLKLGQKA